MGGVLSADVTEVCARYSITSDSTTCQAGTKRQDADAEDSGQKRIYYTHN